MSNETLLDRLRQAVAIKRQSRIEEYKQWRTSYKTTNSKEVNSAGDPPASDLWYTARELQNMKFEKEDMWLVEGLIPRNLITVVAGPSDTGKSAFLRQLAYAVADGDSKFLRFPLYLRDGICNVFYVTTEDGEVGTQYGLSKQLPGLGIDGPLNLYFVTDPSKFEGALREMLKLNKDALLIIDAWADTFAGNPNDRSAVRTDLQKYHAIATKFGITVVMLHHNVKNSEKFKPDKNQLNGSGAMEALARSVMDLRLCEGHPDKRRLTVTKNNYLPPEEKSIGHILKFDGNTMLFTRTDEIANDTPVRSNKYDIGKWKPVIDQHVADTLAADGKKPGLKRIANWLAETHGPDAPKYNWLQQHADELLTPTKGDLDSLDESEDEEDDEDDNLS